jgi:hypothetical protein
MTGKTSQRLEEFRASPGKLLSDRRSLPHDRRNFPAARKVCRATRKTSQRLEKFSVWPKKFLWGRGSFTGDWEHFIGGEYGG